MRTSLQALALSALLAICAPACAEATSTLSCNTPDAETFNGSVSFTHQGQHYTLDMLPIFSDYPAKLEASTVRAADIETGASKDSIAWSYRTRLREGLKHEPDFNGHYKVVTWGCGTGCQTNAILDLTTGKTLGTISSTYGVHYCKNSSLIVSNLSTSQEISERLSAHDLQMYGFDFFKIKDGKLTQIKKVDLRRFIHDPE